MKRFGVDVPSEMPPTKLSTNDYRLWVMNKLIYQTRGVRGWEKIREV